MGRQLHWGERSRIKSNRDKHRLDSLPKPAEPPRLRTSLLRAFRVSVVNYFFSFPQAHASNRITARPGILTFPGGNRPRLAFARSWPRGLAPLPRPELPFDIRSFFDARFPSAAIAPSSSSIFFRPVLMTFRPLSPHPSSPQLGIIRHPFLGCRSGFPLRPGRPAKLPVAHARREFVSRDCLLREQK